MGLTATLGVVVEPVAAAAVVVDATSTVGLVEVPVAWAGVVTGASWTTGEVTWAVAKPGVAVIDRLVILVTVELAALAVALTAPFVNTTLGVGTVELAVAAAAVVAAVMATDGTAA